MTPQDRQKFAAIITGFAEIKGKQLSHAALDLYWYAMQGWNIRDFETAAAHLLRSCEFMPTPKDFKDFGKSNRPTAAEAWSQVLEHLKGGYRDGRGLSTAIDAAVRALGGYRALAMMPSDQLPFRGRDFTAFYEEAARLDEARQALGHDQPEQLPEQMRALLAGSKP